MISQNKVPLTDQKVDKDQLIALFYEQERLKPNLFVFISGIWVLMSFFVFALGSASLISHRQNSPTATLIFACSAVFIFGVGLKVSGFLATYSRQLEFLKSNPDRYELQPGVLKRKAMSGFDPTMSKRTPYLWTTETGLEGKCSRPPEGPVQIGQGIWVAVPTGSQGRAFALAPTSDQTAIL